jgi:hypothetical protein
MGEEERLSRAACGLLGEWLAIGSINNDKFSKRDVIELRKITTSPNLVIGF